MPPTTAKHFSVRLSPQAIWAICIGAAVACGVMWWISGWTGPDQPSAATDLMWVLLTAGPLAAIWLLAAIGLGWPLRRLLANDSPHATWIQIGLGIAAMMTLDGGLGALGVLQWGGSIGAWALIGTGGVLLVVQRVLEGRDQRIEASRHQGGFRQATTSNGERRNIISPFDVSTLRISYAPAVAVLLVAACSAPGVLWATEFGGYDALSYHLQLPKEWLALGSIQPLEHNIYNFLPGFVEAAYYHLAILRGDAIESAYSCQLLHASITILTALATARLVSSWCGPIIGTAAGVIVLGTPWTIVVGSLAYNEIPTLLMLVVGILTNQDERSSPIRRAVIVGILSAAACGAKLTSVGFVALPLLALTLMALPPRRWALSLLTAGAAGFIILLPWLLRNFIACGNPVFPFAADLFGSAHWTAEQIAIWNHGHFSDASLPQRATELWNQVLRYGLGENPNPTEPWKPQWSILPWLGIAGLLIGLARRNTRSIAVRLAVILLIQVAFWLCCTHLKSRFLLPACIPLACGVAFLAMAIRDALPAAARSFLRVAPVIVLAAWSAQSILILRTEGRGAPAAAIGQIGVFTGDDLNDASRRAAGTTAFPAIAINHLLPTNSRVLAIGWATPFYVHTDIDYCTTWDRGPLSALIAAHPNDPHSWRRALRDRGFTHLLVDEHMIDLWERSGWNDPRMTGVSVRRLTAEIGPPLYEYPGNVSIYEFPE